jgi:hypothetical protein
MSLTIERQYKPTTGIGRLLRMKPRIERVTVTDKATDKVVYETWWTNGGLRVERWSSGKEADVSGKKQAIMALAGLNVAPPKIEAISERDFETSEAKRNLSYMGDLPSKLAQASGLDVMVVYPGGNNGRYYRWGRFWKKDPALNHWRRFIEVDADKQLMEGLRVAKELDYESITPMGHSASTIILQRLFAGKYAERISEMDIKISGGIQTAIFTTLEDSLKNTWPRPTKAGYKFNLWYWIFRAVSWLPLATPLNPIHWREFHTPTTSEYPENPRHKISPWMACRVAGFAHRADMFGLTAHIKRNVDIIAAKEAGHNWFVLPEPKLRTVVDSLVEYLERLQNDNQRLAVVVPMQDRIFTPDKQIALAQAMGDIAG